MPCDTEVLRQVPLFSLFDDDERAVLAAHVEMKEFTANQRIYKLGDPGGRAYLVVRGKVKLSTIDEDHQELVVDEPGPGEFFGFASLLDGTSHQTIAVAAETSACIEIDRADLEALLKQKPHAGMDMLAVLGKHFHAAQQLVRARSVRNPNEVIEEQYTFGDRLADSVARFGGSWRFIITFGIVLVVYTAINVGLGTQRAWDPYPFILLNLFLSMLAALQAPVIMMSQNRQDAKDRIRSEADYMINVKAEAEIAELTEKIDRMRSEFHAHFESLHR